MLFWASTGGEGDFTWAVCHSIAKAAWCAPDVFAFCYDLDGGAEGINQAIVDPCWITPAWVDCQGFPSATEAAPWRNYVTPNFDGTGVALSLGAAGSSEIPYYLINGNCAKLYFFI